MLAVQNIPRGGYSLPELSRTKTLPRIKMRKVVSHGLHGLQMLCAINCLRGVAKYVKFLLVDVNLVFPKKFLNQVLDKK